MKQQLKTEDYRIKTQRLYRGSQFCWLPGYEFLNRGLQEAYCCWQPSRSKRSWTFILNYGQLDIWVPYDGIFESALEQVGADGGHIVNDLWQIHENEFSKNAFLHHGGWRWWSGRGLSEPFIHALRDLLINRYTQARALFANWSINPDDPYGFIVPTLEQKSKKPDEIKK
jgi:hypothetical protein